MSVANTVLSYLHILAWPALIGSLALIFRSTIRKILAVRLAQFDAAGFSVKFNTAVKEAEQVTEVNHDSKSYISEHSTTVDLQVYSPKGYASVRTIAEMFRNGKAIMLDLEKIDDDLAKRIIDFSAGLVMMDHGSIERIDHKKFVLTPENTIQAKSKNHK